MRIKHLIKILLVAAFHVYVIESLAHQRQILYRIPRVFLHISPNILNQMWFLGINLPKEPVLFPFILYVFPLIKNLWSKFDVYQPPLILLVLGTAASNSIVARNVNVLVVLLCGLVAFVAEVEAEGSVELEVHEAAYEVFANDFLVDVLFINIWLSSFDFGFVDFINL